MEVRSEIFRLIAAMSVLLFVLLMMLQLINHGYSLEAALGGAGGAGVVAAEVVRRILDNGGSSTGGPHQLDGV